MKSFIILIFVFTTAGIHAQTTSLLSDRIAHSWKLVKMEENGITKPNDPTLNDYRLIFKNDNTVKQGLQPDGFINGTWTVNEASMIISITDKQTKVKYDVKIIKITADEMILQDLSQQDSMMMYYQKAD